MLLGYIKVWNWRQVDCLKFASEFNSADWKDQSSRERVNVAVVAVKKDQ